MAAELGGPGGLPVAAEIDRRLAPHRQHDDAIHLLAVADAPWWLIRCMAKLACSEFQAGLSSA